MGYICTGMGDHFGALLMYLMALQLALVDGSPFGLVSIYYQGSINGKLCQLKFNIPNGNTTYVSLIYQ